MSTWAILATGPSMSLAVANQVRGKCQAAAVSDAYRLAPWANILVSTDAGWWAEHPEAKDFPGPKYTGAPDFLPVKGVARAPWSTSGTNSGLLACMTAYELGATRLLLCGFDMHGSHFFGPHPARLANTTAKRFEAFRRQFAAWRPKGLEILNCTPGSALTIYPRCDLETALQLEDLPC